MLRNVSVRRILFHTIIKILFARGVKQQMQVTVYTVHKAGTERQR